MTQSTTSTTTVIGQIAAIRHSEGGGEWTIDFVLITVPPITAAIDRLSIYSMSYIRDGLIVYYTQKYAYDFYARQSCFADVRSFDPRTVLETTQDYTAHSFCVATSPVYPDQWDMRALQPIVTKSQNVQSAFAWCCCVLLAIGMFDMSTNLFRPRACAWPRVFVEHAQMIARITARTVRTNTHHTHRTMIVVVVMVFLAAHRLWRARERCGHPRPLITKHHRFIYRKQIRVRYDCVQ